MTDGVLILKKLSVRPTKRGSCPKSVRLRATHDGWSVARKVKLSRRRKLCQLSATIALSGEMPERMSVAVVISGKGVKKKKLTVVGR